MRPRVDQVVVSPFFSYGDLRNGLEGLANVRVFDFDAAEMKEERHAPGAGIH